MAVDYTGTTATISGADWGGDWGGDSQWQIQLKELIPVTNGETYDVSFTITSEVDRDVFVKLGNLDNDNDIFLQDTISLTAGEPYVYEGKTDEVTIDQLMVLFALGTETSAENTITITDFSLKDSNSVYVDTTPRVNFEWIDKADFTDGVDVNVAYTGTTATISGSDWGNDWGGDSQWQIQLKELVPVTSGDTYDVSFNITSEVARDVFVKLGNVDNDSDIFLQETVSLEAGVPYLFEGTTDEVTIEQLMVLFALGASDEVGTAENTITISGLTLKGKESGYVKVEEPSDEKGPEYDFTATEDNAANDNADPGDTKEGYDLIWADEFDGNYDGANVDEVTGLNLDNWAYQLGDGSTDCGNQGWGNKEL